MLRTSFELTGDQDHVDKLKAAAVSSRELTALYEKAAALQKKMAEALEREVLKQYKWSGSFLPSGAGTQVEEVTGEQMRTIDMPCGASPVGKCVTSDRHLRTELEVYFRIPVVVCFCCGEKLVKTQKGWMKYSQYLAAKGG